MLPLIMNWAQAYEAGFMACGGKGYHLATLQRYGFPVPDGGVVVADVYRQLMQASVRAKRLHAVSTLHAEDATDPGVQEQLMHIQVRRKLKRPLDGDPRLAACQVSAAAWAEAKCLTFWRWPLLRWLVSQVQRGFALREAGKSGMVALFWPTRHLVFAIGCRPVAGECHGVGVERGQRRLPIRLAALMKGEPP
jgi:hypothetical protein